MSSSVTRTELEAAFGPNMYYFEVKVPAGEDPVQYVSSFAKAEIYVSMLGDTVYAASNDANAIDSSIIVKDVQ